MANDEFSVNELEPERNTPVQEDTTQMEYKEGSDASYLNQEAQVLDSKVNEENEINDTVEQEEYQGPTLKEVLVNSVNPDYQGPTAKEIVVNSVKIDNTKKKNYVGLIVFIIVLVLIGTIVVIDSLGEDKKKQSNYLANAPKWAEDYNKYLIDNYEGIVAYNLSFLDLDFDNKPEAVINYLEDGNTKYEIVDLSDDLNFEVTELTNILMMYSFEEENVSWYINVSTTDVDMRLVNLTKRLNKDTDFELYLSNDNLSQFKSNHFNLSYDIKYTKISFRTREKNLAEAVKVYEKEKDNVSNIVSNTLKKYAEDV